MVITFALYNGLVVLPVVLSMVGPSSGSAFQFLARRKRRNQKELEAAEKMEKGGSEAPEEAKKLNGDLHEASDEKKVKMNGEAVAAANGSAKTANGNGAANGSTVNGDATEMDTVGGSDDKKLKAELLSPNPSVETTTTTSVIA